MYTSYIIDSPLAERLRAREGLLPHCAGHCAESQSPTIILLKTAIAHVLATHFIQLIQLCLQSAAMLFGNDVILGRLMLLLSVCLGLCFSAWLLLPPFLPQEEGLLPNPLLGVVGVWAATVGILGAAAGYAGYHSFKES